ncbi:MAG TPA: tetratricopeptide repeat protein [Sedimentisphaerales bacterium]|nr:tetratricopeptide repeat protein [Sedimentisphaerales bacterium]
MKSEHRHELKTNELAEWIANLPQWSRENYRMIIYVSVVAVLVAGSGLWYWYNKNVESVQRQLNFTSLISRLPQNKMQILMSQTRGVDASYVLIETAGALRAAADGAKDDQMAALALIKQAEALRAGLHYRQEAVDQAELQMAINQAKSAYSQVLERATLNRSLRATARFGLGLCEEELGNFDGARQIYKELVANPDFEVTTAFAQAKHRLETMADYQQKVVFKPSPRPRRLPPDFLEPPSQLGPVDDNLWPPAPNRVPRVLDYNVKPEPNFVFRVLDANQRIQTPNGAPVVPDINIGPKAPNSVREAVDVNQWLDAPIGVSDINVPSK